MKATKTTSLPHVTQDIDWQKYPNAAKWVKGIETEEKKRLAKENDAKSFTELEKKAKNTQDQEELVRTLEARTRGRVNYYLHKNKELGRMCFLRLFGNTNIDFLKSLDRFCRPHSLACA